MNPPKRSAFTLVELPAVSTRKRSAFTLVELLAAMAVLTLLMAMLFAAFNQITRAWTSSENRVETFQTARAAMDFMGRELAQTVGSTNIMFYGNASSVYFVAALPSATNNFGDLYEVGYETSPLPGGQGTITRKLTAPTAANLAANWWNVHTNTWNSTFDSTATACLVSNSVLSLSFQYFDSAGNNTPTFVSNMPPRAVRIYMTLLDSRSVTRYKLSSANAITNENARVFTTLVQLPAGRN